MTTHTTTLDQLRTSRRFLAVGPLVALACMVATFAYGVALDSVPLMVAAFGFTLADAAIWEASRIGLDRRIAREEGR